MSRQEWLDEYEQKLSLLTCPINLNEYFTAKKIAGQRLDRMSIGQVSLPSGEVIVCDPQAGLNPTTKPYFRRVPPGEYEVTLAVIKPARKGQVPYDDENCARYAAARIQFTATEAVRYEQALTGDEDLSVVSESYESSTSPGFYFGFDVDELAREQDGQAVNGGLASIWDSTTRDAYFTFTATHAQAGEADLPSTQYIQVWGPEMSYVAADEALSQGDYSRAAAEFAKILAANPSDEIAKAGKEQAQHMARFNPIPPEKTIQTNSPSATGTTEPDDQSSHGIDLYDSYLEDALAANASKHPRYQRESGEWVNWQIPGTSYHVPIFTCGFGWFGRYSVWFGIDKDNNICSLVVLMIDIEEEYENVHGRITW